MYSNHNNFQHSEHDLSAAMELFKHLNVEELKEILNDDSKCEDIIKDNIQQNKAQESERELLLASNRSLADFNLTYEPRLDAGKKKLRELTEQAQELCLSVQTKAAELGHKSGNMSLDSTLALLQTAAAESEEESEALAEKYLSSELELESFLEQFLVQRRLMHLRRVKADKMAEIIATASPTRPAPPIPSRSPYPSNSVPYPVANSAPYPVANHTPYPSVIPMNMPLPPPY